MNEQLPTSLQALGILIDAMGVRPAIERKVSARTLQTAFHGGRVGPESVSEVVAALVNAAFPNSVAETVLGREDVLAEWKEALRDSLHKALKGWDEARGATGALLPPVHRRDHVIRPWIRLVGFDVGIRWGCWLLATGAKVPSQEWLTRFLDGDAFGATVHETREEAGLTIEQLAGALAEQCHRGQAPISRKTLESWLYRGVLPHFDNLGRLAAALAAPWAARVGAKSQVEAERLLWARLLWSRAASGLHQAIAMGLMPNGAAVARDAADGLASMARFVRSYVGQVAQPDSGGLLWLHVAQGVRGPWAAALLQVAAENTQYPRNAWDLRHAAGPWSQIVCRWYRELSAPEERMRAAVTQETGVEDSETPLRICLDRVLDMPRILRSSEREANLDAAIREAEGRDDVPALESRIAGAQSAKDHRTAAALARCLVRLEPANPVYHLWLGAALGRLGELEEASLECRCADQLTKGGWLLAAAEVGIILFEACNLDAALSEFDLLATRRDREDVPEVVVHVLFHHAMALLAHGRLQDAIDLLRRAIGIDAGHARALDLLAGAVVQAGDRKEGLALAKRAAHLGARGTLEALEQGRL